jgi:hypothetical protein
VWIILINSAENRSGFWQTKARRTKLIEHFAQRGEAPTAWRVPCHVNRYTAARESPLSSI